MAHGAPDWIMAIQVAVTVENEPVIPDPATEEAAGDTGTYTGVDQTYQTVATMTVETGKVAEIKEITVISSDYSKTLIQITVGSIVFCTDFAPQAAIPIIFEDLKLSAGEVVTVECKSSDGTSITVDAIITAKEIES